MGTGLGPAVSGYIELKKGWRWIEWVQVSRPAVSFSLPLRPDRSSCSLIADDVRGRHGGSHHSLHAGDAWIRHPLEACAQDAERVRRSSVPMPFGCGTREPRSAHPREHDPSAM